jgi:tetratricopeptide (TPR) repeat protein
MSLVFILGLFPSYVFAGSEDLYSWHKLLDEKKYEQAKQLCTEWLSRKEITHRTEAHKCLANVALSKSSMIIVEGDDVGGGSLRSGVAGEGVDEALKHLKAALSLSPNDLSIHQGRLHVLMMAGRYSDIPSALLDSIKKYKGDNAIEAWLAYSPRFHAAKQYRAGIEFLKVLDQNYPNEHRVIANLGAFYAMLKDDDNALIFAKKAVDLNPNDPINNWNLGRLYDYTNKIALADKYYLKAIELAGTKATTYQYYCVYSDFVETKLKNTQRACELRKKYCLKDYDEKCGKK